MDATFTIQGDATNPVNRLYPKRIVPWLDVPQLEELVWKKFDRTAGNIISKTLRVKLI